jgi:hypothetical protein
MKPVAKGFLIGCSVLLVLGIAAVIALVLFVKSKSTEFITRGQQMREQGAAFGRYVTESECLTEAMTRYRPKRGMVNGITQGVWLDGCLEPSTLEQHFCTAVPPQTQMTATVKWRVDRCKELGFPGDSTCPNILAAVQNYCESPERRQKMNR